MKLNWVKLYNLSQFKFIFIGRKKLFFETIGKYWLRITDYLIREPSYKFKAKSIAVNTEK